MSSAKRATVNYYAVFIATNSTQPNWTQLEIGKAQFLSVFDILSSSDSVEFSWVCRYEHAKNPTQLNWSDSLWTNGSVPRWRFPTLSIAKL